MIVKVIQPPYFAGDEPDKVIAEFLMDELRKSPNNSLTVLPEYSNAGGLSDAEREIKAMARAEEMINEAVKIAKERNLYVVINVLEKRENKMRNSTYLINKNGEKVFIYDKIHLPPSEVSLGVTPGDGACFFVLDDIRFGFMTCYDVYFNEQIEYIASQKPDIILIPGYQRGERTDIIRAQAKLTAFRANAFVLRSSYSMNSDDHGGCSMIVSPEGLILKDMGMNVGAIEENIDPKKKYMRSAGFGGDTVRNDDFINAGLCPHVFSK